jgi:predicted sulfurtransferase
MSVDPARRQKQCLAEINRLALEHDITGRGRIALEGLNCTLTGSTMGTRNFCEGLRAWDPALFNDTDFKITDGIPGENKFKALTIKSTQELVAYGLGGAVQVASIKTRVETAYRFSA